MIINYSLMSSAGASLYMYKINEVRYSAIARYSFQQFQVYFSQRSNRVMEIKTDLMRPALQFVQIRIDDSGR